MSKRLNVILGDEEYRRLKRTARRHGLTLSEWVRRSLADVQAKEPAADAGRKLAVVRAAAEHEFPTADMEQMLREIEQGYTSES
ncbi:MAG: antitoxin [Gemmatimonadota bacterium]|jgi:hypothetical protein